MFRTRLTVFPMVALAMILPATAQQPNRDAGEFVILSANYGTERHYVDVTQRLREAAKRDMMFRAGNGAFGVDPDPGVAKTLRILVRGPHGREHTFEYREGAMVDGAMFRGWSKGEWGNDRPAAQAHADEGEFFILAAQYGTEHHHVDVTKRLKELAGADRTFRMGNDTFGVDPDFGKRKVLRIYARGLDGRERMFEYLEDGVVDGALFRGWGGREWGNGKEHWSGRWGGQE